MTKNVRTKINHWLNFFTIRGFFFFKVMLVVIYASPISFTVQNMDGRLKLRLSGGRWWWWGGDRTLVHTKLRASRPCLCLLQVTGFHLGG